MKIRIFFFLLLFFIVNLLLAQNSDLKTLMDNLLEKNPDYQQAISRYIQEKSLYTIENSNNWFDINLKYQQYDNDFTRDETEIILEHSDVYEKDKRWSIELEKQFFPKDFDNAKNAIGSRLDRLYYKHDLRLTCSRSLADIFDDMINWYEADANISLIQERLDILYQQNRILEELYSQNQIDPEMLIQNLEDIDDREDDIIDYKLLTSILENKYGDILPEILLKMDDYIKTHTEPDTLGFKQVIDNEVFEFNKEIKKLSNRIKLNYLHFFLPEITLAFSYNWRDTKQTWDIEKNNIFKSMIRNQKEEYPQAEIEISLPFNLFSNTAGKAGLLQAFSRELSFRSTQLQLSWQKFTADRLFYYQSAELEEKRKARLKELYESNLNIQLQKYRQESTLLGSNPELRLQKETIKTEEARIEHRLAQMKLCKEIYLINILGDEIK